ncbi:zinc finger protein 616 [Aplysia californica]|uniref:Zinc finger protein 616 n=1 Tax=Aplysia californica TaxID=6500 RepID=A0ABM0JFC4_APLCA|nr:zinc finger protein 616 [Aplysia californica]
MFRFDPDKNCGEAFNVSGHIDVFIDGEFFSRSKFTRTVKIDLVLNSSNDTESSKDSLFTNFRDSELTGLMTCKKEESSLCCEVPSASSNSSPLESLTSLSSQVPSEISKTRPVKSCHSSPDQDSGSVSENDCEDTNFRPETLLTLGKGKETLKNSSLAKIELSQICTRKTKNTLMHVDNDLTLKEVQKVCHWDTWSLCENQHGILAKGSSTNPENSAVSAATLMLPKQETQEHHDNLKVSCLVEKDGRTACSVTVNEHWNVNQRNEQIVTDSVVLDVEEILEDSSVEKKADEKRSCDASSAIVSSCTIHKATKRKGCSEREKDTVVKDKVAKRPTEEVASGKRLAPRFTCELCGKTFSSRRAKVEHRLNPECEVMCRVCNTVHFSQGSLLAHYCCVHPEVQDLKQQFDDEFPWVDLKVFRDKSDCPLCLKSVSDRGCVVHFDSVHFSNPLYLCCVCGEKFRTELLWREHCSSRHGKKTATRRLVKVNEHRTGISLKDSKTKDVVSEECDMDGQDANINSNFHCKYCKKTFGNYNLLLAHRRKKKIGAATCGRCGLSFSEQAYLIAHERRKHGIGPADKLAESMENPGMIDCPICSAKMKNGSLIEHIRRNHASDFSYKCCVCGYNCKTRDAYARHCEKKHTEKKKSKPIFQCSVCNEKCQTVSEFNSHKATHWKTCIFCGDNLPMRSHLQRHYEEKHLEKLLPCDHCDRKFPSLKTLRTHQKYVQFLPRRPCPKCGVMLYSLRNHMKSMHPEVEVHAQCNVCGKTLKNERSLKEHIVRAHGNRQIICSVCSKVFRHAGALRKHLTTVHFVEKVYECHICGKKCSQKYNLKIHMRVHSLHKAFSCPVCSQGFNYKASLQSHMRSKHPDHEPIP